MRKTIHTFGIAIVAGSLLVAVPSILTGCETSSSSRLGSDNLSLSVSSSAQTVNQGEIVTFMVHDKGTLGRDVDVKWNSSGGDLDVERNGRVARVKFDTPGTYTVVAEFSVDGKPYNADTKQVKVNPLPR